MTKFKEGDILVCTGGRSKGRNATVTTLMPGGMDLKWIDTGEIRRLSTTYVELFFKKEITPEQKEEWESIWDSNE